jgi:hypothetical protein
MVRIIGNSGGTTVVIIKIHLKNNLFLLLSSSSNPYIKTLPIQPGLESSCLTNGSDIDTSEFLSNLRIPFGGLINFPLEIVSYDTTNCQEKPNDDRSVRTYYVKDEDLPVNILNENDPRYTSSNNKINSMRIIKSGDNKSHLFFPDNIVGYSSSTLKEVVPSVSCLVGSQLRHCLTHPSNIQSANSVYRDVKRSLHRVLGTPDGVDPENSGNPDHRDTGEIGDVAWVLSGPVGSAFNSNGLLSCVALPLNFTLPDTGNIYLQGHNIRMSISTPESSIQIPERISSTTSLQYRVDLYVDEQLMFIFGFRCDNLTGWARSHFSQNSETRSSEIYYNTLATSSSKVEYYGYENYQNQGSTYHSRMATQFKKEGNNEYLAHIARTTFNETSNEYSEIVRYIVKSNGTSMRVYQLTSEDSAPDGESTFALTSSLCSASSTCASYCFNNEGVTTSSSCPSISSGDAIQAPAISTLFFFFFFSFYSIYFTIILKVFCF